MATRKTKPKLTADEQEFVRRYRAAETAIKKAELMIGELRASSANYWQRNEAAKAAYKAIDRTDDKMNELRGWLSRLEYSGPHPSQAAAVAVLEARKKVLRGSVQPAADQAAANETAKNASTVAALEAERPPDRDGYREEIRRLAASKPKRWT